MKKNDVMRELRRMVAAQKIKKCWEKLYKAKMKSENYKDYVVVVVTETSKDMI